MPNPSPPSAREIGGISLLLACLLLLFFHAPLTPGHILSPAGAIFSRPFFFEAAPPGSAGPSNPLLFDQVYQFQPWRSFIWHSLRQGRWPLWNPYSLSGAPLVATMQSAVFYPINLLLTVLPFPQTFVGSAILRLWIAGISTYALMRRYGLGRAAALLSAVSFMLCGFLIVWLGHPHTNAAIWLPALILLAERLAAPEDRRRRMRTVALLALVIGVQFTGGHIETSVDILTTFGLYFLIRWIQTSRQRKAGVWHQPALLVLAVVLGTGLAAVQILPFLEWLPLSAELQHRAAGGFSLFYAGFWRDLASLPALIYPNIFNCPSWPYPYVPYLRVQPALNYNENIFYVGTLPLLLACLAVFSKSRRDPLVKAWLILGIISLGRALHLPIIDGLNHLPGLSLSNPDRQRLPFAFSLCVLGGFGLRSLQEAVAQGDLRVLKSWRRLCFFIIGAGILLAVISNLLIPRLQHQLLAQGRAQVDAVFSQERIHPHPLQEDYALVDQAVAGLSAAFQVTHFGMYGPAFWALAGLIAVSRRSPSSRRFALPALFVAFVAADLVIFGSGYNPVLPAHDFFPKTSLVSYMAQDPSLYRFTAIRQDVIPDTQVPLGLPDVRGLDFPTVWYDRYMTLTGDRQPWIPYGLILSGVDSPLLRVLNLKYIATFPGEVPPDQPGLTLVKQSTGIQLWQIPDPQPRSFLVYDAVTAANDDQAAQLLQSDPAAVYHRVVISRDAHTPPPPAVHPFIQPGQVTLLDYEPGQASWQVTTPQDGYLFTGDAFYPGWQALLDGRPVPLYRANLAFRAVSVPPGTHTITYRYVPRSITVGAAISAVSLLCILGLLLSPPAGAPPNKA